jgi:hypothetical protein
MTTKLVSTKAGVIARIKTTYAGTRLCILEKSIIAIRHNLNIQRARSGSKPDMVAHHLIGSDLASGRGEIHFAPSSEAMPAAKVSRAERSSWHWFELPSEFAAYDGVELGEGDISFDPINNRLSFCAKDVPQGVDGYRNVQPPTTTEATGHTMGLDIENTTPSEKEIIVAFLRRVPYFAELTKTDQKTISKSLASRFDRHTHPSTLGPVVATFMNFLRDQVEDGSIK